MINPLDLIPTVPMPTYIEWMKTHDSESFVSSAMDWLAENLDFLTDHYECYCAFNDIEDDTKADFEMFVIIKFAILRYNQEMKTKKEIEDMCRPFAGILGNQFK